ncbi:MULTISPECIES: transposase [Pseudomonas]|uniref:transposase n=1 Tax=Pseudomonas TaxID=286 RepID=UPI000F005AB1|nr:MULTISPECIES: transposase [Pseudomonas]MCF5779261.1 transposase [Pseudomonas poae]
MDTSSSLLSGYFVQSTRRSYSKSFRAQVIQECAQPGASIASIALSHNLVPAM